MQALSEKFSPLTNIAVIEATTHDAAKCKKCNDECIKMIQTNSLLKFIYENKLTINKIRCWKNLWATGIQPTRLICLRS